MSADATGWAYRCSPAKGATFLVHLAIADSVNDLHRNEFWMSVANLATKARVSERATRDALHELEELGLLQLLQEARHKPRRYRFVFAELPAVYESRYAPSADLPTEPEQASPAESAYRGLQPVPSGLQPVPPNPIEPKEPSQTETLPVVASDDTTLEMVNELCSLLADAVAAHGAAHAKPNITEAWRRDMSLLLRRGPKGAQPAPLDPERVARCIAVLFSELAEPDGSGGFCWADQVQSPAALRRHWTRIANAARAKRQAGTPTTKRARMFDALRSEANSDASVVDIGSRKR